jgi:hypothetical protein
MDDMLATTRARDAEAFAAGPAADAVVNTPR